MTTKPDDQSPDSHFTRGVARETAEVVTEFPYSWFSQAGLAAFTAAPGIQMQSFSGSAVMVNWVTIEPNRPIPRHQHPHEQIGVMIEGAMELTIGDETRVLRPGDAYNVPPHLPHGGRTLEEGCVVLDVFTPVREDYAALAKAAAESSE
jgi:quercetin dioxygenase-like cupin family protein